MFKYFILPVFLSGYLLSVNAWSESGNTQSRNRQLYANSISRLSSLVNDVLNNNPGIKSVQAEQDAVIAKAAAADQPLYNPKLVMDVENTEIQTSSLGIDQTIDWSDKRNARSRTARFKREGFAAKLTIARQDLAAELLQALANYHTQRDMDALTKQRIELLRGFLGLAKKRRQSGDLSQAELTLAQLAFAEASMQRTRAATRLMKTQQRLIALVGRNSHVWPNFPAVLPKLNLADKKLEAILTRLPVLQEQQSLISAARANIHLRQREQRPDPTIGLRGGRENSDSLIGLSFSVPLFVRNNFSAEVDVANAELIQRERKTQNIARKARAKLLFSAHRYQLVRQTWQDWQQTGQASLSEQVKLIQQIWQAGEISTTEYFMQLNQTLDTRRSAIELRNDLWHSWVDWLLASGRVNAWLGLDN
ncbi:hypothetical protein MNBD_GAMMA24-858 [hydrothermal vent metagenome]|uniref:Heavy metal RND efflux outer membrane protein, CzcC family n=1 Tax=hydrothermal vent metagenome TaxID=652676 RepID=A0A3B1BUQ1_9ZZZZ